MDCPIISVDADGDHPLQIVWTNESTGRFRYLPEQFNIRVDVDLWRASAPTIDAVRLHIPPTWVSDLPTWRRVCAGTTSIEWQVTAHEPPKSFDESISVSALSADDEVDTVTCSVGVEIRAFSQFDASKYVIPRSNSVDEWGTVQPRSDVFDRTYAFTFFPVRFFNGLYRSIVFMGAIGGRYQGGICTGMARVALERSLSADLEEVSVSEIMLWHGRQLTDRALLASARWFLAPSPRRAFNAFQRDVLNSGISRRCFDIAVPRPWRRDVYSALQQEGHTVVPFGIRQSSSDSASVMIYDPNDPVKSRQGSASITFLLDENTYLYPPLGGLDLKKTSVIAVEQQAYRDGRTAILASLASCILGVGESMRHGLSSLMVVVCRLGSGLSGLVRNSPLGPSAFLKKDVPH